MDGAIVVNVFHLYSAPHPLQLRKMQPRFSGLEIKNIIQYQCRFLFICTTDYSLLVNSRKFRTARE